MDFALSKLNDLISVFERIPPDEMYRNMLVALKEEKLSLSIIVHQFNDWRDIFDTFIDDNQIKLHVDPTDLDPVFKSYRFKMQKNVLISQLRKLKYKLCEQLVKTDYQPMFDSIPKQYLSSLIEQYALKALYDADRMGISYDSVRNVISSQNNNTLYHIFSFLEWNESYRVVYDESKHYQSMLFISFKIQNRFEMKKPLHLKFFSFQPSSLPHHVLSTRMSHTTSLIDHAIQRSHQI
eukprot:608270_1